MNNPLPPYVIIGSGAAGIAAAEAIRSIDSASPMIMVSDDPAGYYSRPGLAYYLTGELPEEMLFPFRETDFTRLNLQRILARAEKLDPNRQEVLLSTGQWLAYGSLLIATGASAVPAALPGSDLAGVVKLDTLADARQIIALSRKTRQAVVVGGGITALEIVEGLSARRIKVHYLLRGDRYWNNVLDEDESTIVQHALVKEGVRLHFRSEIAEIEGKKGQVTGVVLKNGETIPCQMVAIAIGVRPRVELARSAGALMDKGIQVDEYLRTSLPNVWAAGDCAQVFDPLAGKYVVDSLWSPARWQGHTAGLNMAGQAAHYERSAPINVTRLAGLTTTIIGAVATGQPDLDAPGIVRGDSETWRTLPDAIAAQAGFEVNRLRLMVGKNTILGAIVMGDQTLSQAIQYLVAEQADISPIREQILAGGRGLADTVANFYTQWKTTRRPTHAWTV